MRDTISSSSLRFKLGSQLFGRLLKVEKRRRNTRCGNICIVSYTLICVLDICRKNTRFPVAEWKRQELDQSPPPTLWPFRVSLDPKIRKLSFHWHWSFYSNLLLLWVETQALYCSAAQHPVMQIWYKAMHQGCHYVLVYLNNSCPCILVWGQISRPGCYFERFRYFLSNFGRLSARILDFGDLRTFCWSNFKRLAHHFV